jgi:hypothetical protein
MEHVIWPDRDGDGVGDVGPEGALVKFRVAVYTSDVRYVRAHGRAYAWASMRPPHSLLVVRLYFVWVPLWSD